jgi:hypothetical protein
LGYIFESYNIEIFGTYIATYAITPMADIYVFVHCFLMVATTVFFMRGAPLKRPNSSTAAGSPGFGRGKACHRLLALTGAILSQPPKEKETPKQALASVLRMRNLMMRMIPMNYYDF